MGHLDHLAISCLRRTSRIFLRLFTHSPIRPIAEYTELITQYDDPIAQYHGPWPRQISLSYDEKSDLRQILFRDKYCGPCHGVRRWRFGYPLEIEALCSARLFCGGCGALHSAGMFSAGERVVADPERRACLAHEGHLRVCQHRVISWADIQRWSGFLGEHSQTYTVRVCGARSHMSSCSRGPISVGSGGVAVVLQRVEEKKLQVTVQWDVHVSVPRMEGSLEKYDAAEVRRISERLHADAGQFIVPSFQEGAPPHMAAFDPNYCACLQYPGRRLLDWQMPELHEIHEARDCCRKARSGTLFTSHKNLRRRVYYGAGHTEHTAKWEMDVGARNQKREFRVSFKRCCREEGGMCLVVSHRHEFV
ncbi:hypothetical protein IMZ48_27580, partial [Candidatus Bathyarchaeota archaeon]|nr:hypothetical protein [Candidatus Bathyarchaeota archaeon]